MPVLLANGVFDIKAARKLRAGVSRPKRKGTAGNPPPVTRVCLLSVESTEIPSPIRLVCALRNYNGRFAVDHIKI